jgi:putative glutathione S-transferase
MTRATDGELYQMPGIAATVNMDHIKRHYYGSHRRLNPGGVVPKGPQLGFMAPHDRGRLVATESADTNQRAGACWR